MAMLVGCVAEPCLSFITFAAWCQEHCEEVGQIAFLRHELSIGGSGRIERSHLVARSWEGEDLICAWCAWDGSYLMGQVVQIRDALLSRVQREQRKGRDR